MFCNHAHALLCGVLTAGVLVIVCAPEVSAGQVLQSDRSFTIENNRFVKDGKPLQIISGRWEHQSNI